jgi:phosphatidylinositol-3-phosphatase
MSRALALSVAVAVLLVAAAPAMALPPVKHVFVIVLENKDYEQSFGETTEAPFLARELTKQGQLLPQYYGTSHASLGNYISMVSGIAANPDTQGDCAHGFNDVFPGTPSPDGQVIGVGCVYPAQVKTVADQLDAAGLTWRGYMEDMANDPNAPKTCRHPASGEIDDTQSARATDQYATRHNPFVYFHSITDDKARCDRGVVPLDQLRGDLTSAASTPNLVFITPDLCSDGHDEPCIDGRPGGLKSSDVFVKEWVPRLMASPAYSEGGLIVVTWDEGNVGGGTSGACCNEPSGPNTPQPGIFGPGGGRTGTLLISPFTKAGSVNEQPYNHYGLLRSIEDLFGLSHLGYAGASGLKAFGDDVFNGLPAGAVLGEHTQACTSSTLPSARSGRYPRGTLVTGVSLTGRLLRLTARHAASLTVRGAHGVELRARLRACRSYTLRVRGRRVALAVRARGAYERRTVRAGRR